MIACPICSVSAAAVFDCQGYPIHECTACHHRFTPPRESPDHVADTYNDAYFFEGGAGYADYLSEETLLLRHAQQYAAIANQRMSAGRMLDVGAAAGFTMATFASNGWRTHGVEPNRKMAHHAIERSGADVSIGTLEDLDDVGEFDLVTMIQVVAHFYDLEAAARRASALTKQGGYWLVETWNYRSWTARAFGKHWHEYSPPSVLHWFSPGSLTRLAEAHGMKRVAGGRPKKRINGGHAKSLLDYRCSQSSFGRLIRPLTRLLPDDSLIPYPAEDLFWAMFQKE